MEIKKHHHAVPIILTIATLLALSVVALNHFTTNQYAATRALTTRVFDIQPTKNGLTKITVHRPTTVQNGPDWTQAGSEAILNLSLR